MLLTPLKSFEKHSAGEHFSIFFHMNRTLQCFLFSYFISVTHKDQVLHLTAAYSSGPDDPSVDTGTSQLWENELAVILLCHLSETLVCSCLQLSSSAIYSLPSTTLDLPKLTTR